MIKRIILDKNAFTLIEITIALLIMAVGLIGILTLFPVGFDAAARANNMTIATFLAQEKLEDAKKLGYAGVADEAGSFDAPYDDFSYTLSVAQVGSLELKEVEVVVSWSSDQNVTLTTYIANYEP